MISKKSIRNKVFEVICLLRSGQTGFNRNKALELADRLELAMAETDPKLSFSASFFISLDGKSVRCRFAAMPAHIPYKKKKGILYINSKKQAEFLAGVKKDEVL